MAARKANPVSVERITQAIVVPRGQRVLLDSDLAAQGAIQAANVLNSPRAIAIGIYVVRAFVMLRELLTTNRELAAKLDELEVRLGNKLTEHDKAIAAILAAIRELMRPAEPVRRGIGFTADLVKIAWPDVGSIPITRSILRERQPRRSATARDSRNSPTMVRVGEAG